jgi:hypothetical protein
MFPYPCCATETHRVKIEVIRRNGPMAYHISKDVECHCRQDQRPVYPTRDMIAWL